MAIKPIPHRIEEHANFDRADVPAATQVLTYADPLWDAQAGGGGGGAPTDASYVVGAAHAGLSAELVLGTAVIMAGTEAAIPAASLGGRLYFATDTLRVFRDTGAAWVQIAGLSLNDMSGDVATAQIENAAVTLAKIANIATARILGRTTAGAGCGRGAHRDAGDDAPGCVHVGAQGSRAGVGRRDYKLPPSGRDLGGAGRRRGRSERRAIRRAGRRCDADRGADPDGRRRAHRWTPAPGARSRCTTSRSRRA